MTHRGGSWKRRAELMDIMAIEDGPLPLTYATQTHTHTHASNYLQQCKIFLFSQTSGYSFASGGHCSHTTKDGDGGIQLSEQ